MSKAQTFKRAKLLKILDRYHHQMNRARIEWEDYELRKRTAAGPDAERYYENMANLYQGKFTSLRATVTDLCYEFSVDPEELERGGEGD